MSEHAWVLENIEAYNAGGLGPGERERLEQHTAECSTCARVLEDTSAVDRGIDALFADVRPSAALEDRMIHALRTKSGRNGSAFAWVAWAAAAVVLFGVVGAGASHFILDAELPFPGIWGSDRAQAENNLKQLAVRTESHADKWVDAYGRADQAVDRTHTWKSALSPTNSSLKDVNELAEESRKSALMMLDSIMDGTANTISAGDATVKGTDRIHTYLGDDTRSMAGGMPANQRMGGMAKAESADQPRGGMPGMGGRDAREDRRLVMPGSTMLDPARVKAVQNRFQQKFKGQFDPSNPDDPLGSADETDQKSAKSGTTSDAETGKPAGKQIYSYRNESPTAGYVAFSKDGKPIYSTPGPAEPQKAERADNKYYFRPADFGLGAFKEGERIVKGEGKEANRPSAANFQPPANGEAGRDAGAEGQGKNKTGTGPGQGATKPPAEEQPSATRRKIIRTGDIEFEIESFDSAVATVTKLINGIKGGFIGTVNSDKLANGKMRGTVVVRMPPEALDSFVLDLRKELGKGGELKSLKIGSQDITKQYTDMESRLKAARTMEERLLKIIKEGKGEIKDLLNAEKELGVWRTKIEEMEGELRYYANQVALSTLTITLYEKEIRSPYAIVETERINTGIEVEDVDKAQQQLLAAVAEAKGRVTKSELKQQAAGQYNAIIHFEVAPESAGILRDRLRQIGTVTRLDIDRLQQTEGGSGDTLTAKSKRNATQFQVQLYNVATVTPRETVQINLACVDAEAVYRVVLGRVQKISGRVITSNLNRQKDEQTTATIDCDVKTADADALLDELKKAGDVLKLQVNENPDVQNVTRARRGFKIFLVALGQVQPRETQVIQLASRDVPAGYRALLEAVVAAKGRVINSQLNEQDKQNINADVDFDIRRADEEALRKALDSLGDVFSRTATRAPDNENVLDTKLRMRVSLRNASSIPPRQTIVLAIEVADVDKTAAAIATYATELQAQTFKPNISHERDGRVTATLLIDVPLANADRAVSKFRETGIVRVQRSDINEAVPDGKLAIARINVTLSNDQLIIPSDEGLWKRVRTGLSNSLLAIFWSLSWVIFGVLVLLPWALVGYAIYRIVLRVRGRPGSSTPVA